MIATKIPVVIPSIRLELTAEEASVLHAIVCQNITIPHCLDQSSSYNKTFVKQVENFFSVCRAELNKAEVKPVEAGHKGF